MIEEHTFSINEDIMKNIIKIRGDGECGYYSLIYGLKYFTKINDFNNFNEEYFGDDKEIYSIKDDKLYKRYDKNYKTYHEGDQIYENPTLQEKIIDLQKSKTKNKTIDGYSIQYNSKDLKKFKDMYNFRNEQLSTDYFPMIADKLKINLIIISESGNIMFKNKKGPVNGTIYFKYEPGHWNLFEIEDDLFNKNIESQYLSNVEIPNRTNNSSKNNDTRLTVPWLSAMSSNNVTRKSNSQNTRPPKNVTRKSNSQNDRSPKNVTIKSHSQNDSTQNNIVKGILLIVLIGGITLESFVL